MIPSPLLRARPRLRHFGLVLCAFALTCMPSTAHAYLDPGTGSMIFQSFLAVIFGIGVAFRQLRQWLARAWAFVLRRQPPGSDLQ